MLLSECGAQLEPNSFHEGRCAALLYVDFSSRAIRVQADGSDVRALVPDNCDKMNIAIK